MICEVQEKETMEVPFEREQEEDELETSLNMNMNMNKRSHLSKKPLSPTISDSSSCVSNQSSTDISFDHFVTTNALNHTTLPEVHVDVIQQESSAGKIESLPLSQDSYLNFDQIYVAPNEGTNGFSVHQNGNGGVYSIHESNGGDKETDVRSNGGLSKSPDTAAGFKFAASLLDESPSDVIPDDILTAENGSVSQNKNAGVLQAEEMEQEVEEYDVERVIQKQETHDLYCPNCSSCITKRVILRRRKRKIQEISTAEEVSGLVVDQNGLPAASDNVAEESQEPPQVGRDLNSRLDGISCFSCFSIFVPSGEGFLCWRFKPKAVATRHPDGTSIDIGQAEDSNSDSAGTIFPQWIVTFCQPAERKKSDTEASTRQTEPPLPPFDDLKPLSSTPEILVPQDTTGLPHIERPQHGAGSTLHNKPSNLIKPYGDTSSFETPNTTTNEGSSFPLWIMTCCQPSMAGAKLDRPAKLDGTAPPRETPSGTFGDTKPHHLVKPDGNTPTTETPSAPSGNTESDHVAKPDVTLSQSESQSEPLYGTRPPLALSDEANPLSQFEPDSPVLFVPGTSSPSKLITALKPNDDIPVPSQTESAAASISAVLARPPKPQPPVIQSDTHGTEALVDVETGLARESPRPGVSGLDVIKATVYGGLLESITSLSVIASAAGGDATTLNIVALGLANVFGGLVVLVHNLRVLKHEHTTEHYEAQLGRPGHYMLHAVVAIMSYLVFGLMSPIIYGFSFRKSDNKDYKLATLAASALACIALLSVAKAYVRNPPKGYFKTVFYYLTLGFMVSGLGYVAGDVINMLLKKLGVFDPKDPNNVSVLAAGLVNGSWSSY